MVVLGPRVSVAATRENGDQDFKSSDPPAYIHREVGHFLIVGEVAMSDVENRFVMLGEVYCEHRLVN